VALRLVVDGLRTLPTSRYATRCGSPNPNPVFLPHNRTSQKSGKNPENRLILSSKKNILKIIPKK
jgi:hypothetical protein